MQVYSIYLTLGDLSDNKLLNTRTEDMREVDTECVNRLPTVHRVASRACEVFSLIGQLQCQVESSQLKSTRASTSGQLLPVVTI